VFSANFTNFSTKNHKNGAGMKTLSVYESIFNLNQEIQFAYINKIKGVEIVDGHIVNCDPATGHEINRVRCTTPREADTMISAARDAQLDWQLSYKCEQRGELIKEGLRTLGTMRDELASMITSEMGKIKSEAMEEANGAINKNAWIDAIVQANQPVALGEAGGAQSLIVRDALGVVIVLAP
jgi:acyl-CoA reductase-like NAD-dependent aldehyde dehydrogenase